MSRKERLILGLASSMLVLVVGSSRAGGDVPPPQSGPGAQSSVAQALDATAAALDGASVSTDFGRAAISVQGVVERGFPGHMRSLDKASGAFGGLSRAAGGAADAVTLYRACGDFGSIACGDTLGNVGARRAREILIDTVIPTAVPAPLRPAYSLGAKVGDGIRLLPNPFDSKGRSIGDSYDDALWDHAAGPITNYLRYGHADPLSEEAVEAGMRRSRELRARQFESARERRRDESGSSQRGGEGALVPDSTDFVAEWERMFRRIGQEAGLSQRDVEEGIREYRPYVERSVNSKP